MWAAIWSGIIWLASAVGIQLTVETAKFLAEKAFLTALMLFVVPVALFKFFSILLKFVLTYAMNHVTTSGLTPGLVTLSGIAGNLAYHLMIPQAVAVLLSAALLSFTFGFLRMK